VALEDQTIVSVASAGSSVAVIFAVPPTGIARRLPLLSVIPVAGLDLLTVHVPLPLFVQDATLSMLLLVVSVTDRLELFVLTVKVCVPGAAVAVREAGETER
jgi:hypothetical protein